MWAYYAVHLWYRWLKLIIIINSRVSQGGSTKFAILSQIWLAEIGIDCGLDFPIQTGIQFASSNVQRFLFFFISITYWSAKKPDDKESKEDEQIIMAGLS